MPYKIEKIKLPESLDRRVKIPKSSHAIILKLHKNGIAIRAIARNYGVNKRLIQFILYPERQAIARAGREWRNYYNKDKHRQNIKNTRHYKQGLHLKGKI